MKKLFILASLSSSILTLSACKHFVSTDYWSYQQITLRTQPPGALCTLHNRRGSWIVKKTPHTFKIRRTNGTLQVFCHKPGFQPATKLVKAYAPLMLKGNLEPNYHPGPEDYNYRYPDTLTVKLNPNTS